MIWIFIRIMKTLLICCQIQLHWILIFNLITTKHAFDYRYYQLISSLLVEVVKKMYYKVFYYFVFLPCTYFIQYFLLWLSCVCKTKITKIIKQVAGASFGGPLLICLLNLTLNEKLSLHSLQFVSKYHVSLDSLRLQIQ